MILTGPEIERERTAGRIVIEPFDKECINPNSYNFSLGDSLKVYASFPVDPRKENVFRTLKIPPQGLELNPRQLYLGHTCEVLGGDHYAPTFAARSSVARMGIFINLSSPLGDIGYQGQWTLQLYAIHPVVVYPGMRIGQMMWWRPSGELLLYRGKYQGATGPRATLIHRDFNSLASAADTTSSSDEST